MSASLSETVPSSRSEVSAAQKVALLDSAGEASMCRALRCHEQMFVQLVVDYPRRLTRREKGNTVPTMQMQPSDALTLQYKRDHQGARRNLDVLDLMNDPGANGVCRVLGLGLTEQRLDLRGIKVRSLLDHRRNSALV